MTDRAYDLNTWLDTYKGTFAAFTKAQQDGFKALDRFARFQYAVAGDVLEAGLAQTRAALGVRATVGTEAVTELLQQQAEVGTQLSEKLKARAEEFSALAAEVQESVGSFTAETTGRGRRGRKAA
jgi:hypothetical protein